MVVFAAFNNLFPRPKILTRFLVYTFSHTTEHGFFKLLHRHINKLILLVLEAKGLLISFFSHALKLTLVLGVLKANMKIQTEFDPG